MKRFSLILLAFLLLAGVAQAQKKAGKAEKTTPSSQVLAVFDGEKITLQDYREALKSLPAQLQWAVSQNKDLRTKFLDNLVTKRMLIKAAKESGVKEDEEMRRRLEEYKNELLLNRYLKERLGNIKVTDAEARAYYERHKDEFTTPKEVKARHILVKSQSEAEKIYKELQKGANFAQLAKK